MTENVAAVSPEEYQLLNSELNQLMKDQAAGLLKQQPNETEDAWKTRTAARMKRGIELTAILRRSNTGPAAPKGKKKVASKDMTGLAKSLLG